MMPFRLTVDSTDTFPAKEGASFVPSKMPDLLGFSGTFSSVGRGKVCRQRQIVPKHGCPRSRAKSRKQKEKCAPGDWSGACFEERGYLRKHSWPLSLPSFPCLPTRTSR